MSFIKSKHSGWTWELKRTPFGGGGGSFRAPAAPAFQNPNPDPHNAPQAPARDVVKETMQQRMQAAQAQQAPVQQAPVQQAAPVSPLVQQMQQQQMPSQMMRGLGYGQQQPGLQSMLARILGGGGGYMPQQGMPQQGMPQQGMPPQMMQQGMPQQGYGQPQMRMPSYGQYGGQNPLAFRPDMSQMQQNLSRVKPSVQRQNQDAQAARIAELEAQLANNPFSSLSRFSGGD